MINVAILIGSLRKDSYNSMLANHLKNRYTHMYNVDIIDLDIPNYNEDLDNDELRPQSVVELIERVNKADAVFVITPEYNHSISGIIKNKLDWLSRARPGLSKKPGIAMALSQGMTAGARAYAHLISILDTMPMYLLPGFDVLVGAVHNRFDENGNLSDQATIDFIDLVINEFNNYYNKVK